MKGYAIIIILSHSSLTLHDVSEKNSIFFNSENSKNVIFERYGVCPNVS